MHARWPFPDLNCRRGIGSLPQHGGNLQRLSFLASRQCIFGTELIVPSMLFVLVPVPALGLGVACFPESWLPKDLSELWQSFKFAL
jgi:hypothetical protein